MIIEEDYGRRLLNIIALLIKINQCVKIFYIKFYLEKLTFQII
jgi:hypothetical protein